EIIYELNQWLKIIGYEVTVFEPYIRSGVENKNKQLKIIEDEIRNKIKGQFLESDEINKKLPLFKKTI
ncbi:40667_t:CDS:1, partial [Gigaspora margarita]